MMADRTILHRQLQVYKGLVEVSALINGITESTELLPAILDVARRVLNVEAASLFLVTKSGDLELATASGGGRIVSDHPITVPRGRGVAGWVLENRAPLLVPDAYKDPRFFPEVDRQTNFKTRSILCVPLLRGNTEIGVLQGLNPIGRESFDSADLEAFTAYGNLAATAIDKVRTIERQQEQKRVAQEFAFAQEIQASLLPQILPESENLSFAATYRPAQNVGGDFYDVVETGPGEFYFVIGDVAGKGMPAALLMAQALSMLRSILKSGIAPQDALARWNALLWGRTIRGMFITTLLGRIVLGERKVELASAGHCFPFRISRDRSPAEIRLCGAPPIGILQEVHCLQETITLEDAEWLVLFTDGLVESFDEDGFPLDRAGLTRVLDRPFQSASDVIDAINIAELNHRGSAEPHDDLTVLVFGFRGRRL
ncbi:MAG: PP2C family protein-serine/threonine phosphatase [Chthoniobacteraceae bacterium]